MSNIEYDKSKEQLTNLMQQLNSIEEKDNSIREVVGDVNNSNKKPLNSNPSIKKDVI